MPPLHDGDFVTHQKVLDWCQFTESRILTLRVKANNVTDTLGGFSSEEIAEGLRALKVTMEAHVLRDRIADENYTGTVDVPATWWDHWKQDHAPGWLLRRRPVRYRQETVTVHVERYLHYPEARIAFPDLGRATIFERAWVAGS